jgi:NADH-quinone oxidoreductase subunit L
MQKLYLLVPLAPLAGAILAGFFGRRIGRAGAHWATILGVAVSFAASCYIAADVFNNGTTFDGPLYTWAVSGGIEFQVGFLIDRLTVLMMIVVTFVSLMVHIYTIGYMADDDGYQRFFAYISLFTFAMLMLVMANNFLQLFFGWEAVGLVSYLLIGFWYKRPSAIYANLKAFLVNRVGDFGFVLGIGLIAAYFGSMHYATVFELAPKLAGETVTLLGDTPWLLMTVICVCLFIGAMGKSAQFPLHVWLPDSMEGPTPISALIHAATMVTAGIFMVARMSPLFELSETALSFVMIIGAITAFFMALIALVVYDIKRVVAYSTLSQLGYMTVALGASAYPAAIFHLYTHAFFKAALFLAAGSVIIAMHHEQDMRRMGGLRKYLPVTYAVMLVGGLANAAVPPFAGFFSKETIIEAARVSTTPGHWFAYACVLACAYVTALYTFRMIFYAFHGKERFGATAGHAADGHGDDHVHGRADGRSDHEHDGHDEHHGGPPRESPWVVTLPLVLLAIPSVVAGYVIGRVVFGDYFGAAIYIAPEHTAIARLAENYHGVVGMLTHAFATLPFWLVVAGIGTAWYLYIARPELPGVLRVRFAPLVRVLENKYGLDDLNQKLFGDGAVGLGRVLWKAGDQAVIDGVAVNGSAKLVGWVAQAVRRMQTGLVNTYAFAMIGTVAIAIGLTYFFMIRPLFQN